MTEMETIRRIVKDFQLTPKWSDEYMGTLTFYFEHPIPLDVLSTLYERCHKFCDDMRVGAECTDRDSNIPEVTLAFSW
jgi:hypothetical protein